MIWAHELVFRCRKEDFPLFRKCKVSKCGHLGGLNGKLLSFESKFTVLLEDDFFITTP
jgi:hypothetical protein